MINAILISILLAFGQPNEKYQVEINSSLTKTNFSKLVAMANDNGLIIKVLYESYDTSGKLKVVQFKASVPNVGEGNATFSADQNDCMIIYKDLSPKAEAAFGIELCGKE